MVAMLQGRLGRGGTVHACRLRRQRVCFFAPLRAAFFPLLHALGPSSHTLCEFSRLVNGHPFLLGGPLVAGASLLLLRYSVALYRLHYFLEVWVLAS